MNFKDKKIAVIGVSDNEDKYGFKIFRDLLAAGYDVSGVHPKTEEVLGRKIYRKLKDIKDIPDIVITVIPPQSTEKVVDECNDLGVKMVWMQPGSESDKAVKKAKEHGIEVRHSACFMVENGIW